MTTPNPSEKELKVWPDFFDALANGSKLFELRYDDRGFEVGDTLRLREYAPGPDEYTGREMTDTVSYIVRASDIPFGAAALKPGFCIIGLSGQAAYARGVEDAAKVADGYVERQNPEGEYVPTAAVNLCWREIATAIRRLIEGK